MLDIETSIIDGKIETSVHYKPTDKHAMLRWDSHHPQSCRESIPFSQFLRLKRLCSSEDVFEVECTKMSKFFEARGYPLRVIEKGRERAASMKRADILNRPRAIEKTSKVQLSIPFCEQTKSISGIIKRNARILAADDDIGCCFTDNIITAYKNTPNLRQRLVRAALPSDEIPGTFPCGRKNCKTCPYVDRQTLVIGPMGQYEISHSYSCSSTDVGYVITCTKCGKLYIGETCRCMGTRFREHISRINRRDMNCELTVHMMECNGGVIELLTVRGLFTVHDTALRRCREASLVRKLGTLVPYGMNREKSSWQRAVGNA